MTNQGATSIGTGPESPTQLIETGPTSISTPLAKRRRPDDIESIDRGSEGTHEVFVGLRTPKPELPRDTLPIQIWEGVVVGADDDCMTATLTDKTGGLADHTVDISLEWVSEQDRNLVLPGAVFYLSLYKETRHKTVSNFEEIRFRRLPAWSATQIQKIHAEAKNLYERFSTK